MNKIHIDFETFSYCDITKSGAWAYSKHPTTRVLCMAYAIDNQPVQILTNTKEIAQLITFWLMTDCYLVAWNSFFEMSICYNTLKIKESLNFEQWIDPMARAAYLALPRSLGECAIAIGLPQDEQKDKQGKSLISFLCKPFNGEQRRDPQRFNQLLDYCKQDVVTERAIYNSIGDLPLQEIKIWQLDQKINARGVRIDLENVEHALSLIEEVKNDYNLKASELTNGAINKLSLRQKMVDYLVSLGCTVEGLGDEPRRQLLNDENTPPLAKQLLELYGSYNKNSTAKYEALKIITCGGRARGLLAYHGASTGRWSGRLFQPQNLPRPSFKDTDGCIELFKHKNPKELKKYSEPMDCLSSCLRGMIIPSKGNKLVVADYSAIEARILPWLANQKDILNIFEKGEDIYKYQASKIYNKDYQNITSDERFIGKVATLALGYGGGKIAFSNMASNYNVEISEDLADKIKEDWRKSNSNIVKFWIDVETAVKNVIKKSKQHPNCGQVIFERIGKVTAIIKGSFLAIRLPSGRTINYYKPSIQNNQICFFATGTNGKLMRQTTYGGKLVENITQAVARDIMAYAMLNVENAGFKIVLSVHDELITEIEENKVNSDLLCSVMCDKPQWADGLPLSAEGFISERYRK